MNVNNDFNYLLQGYIAGTLSDEEKRLLLEALNDQENVNKLSAIVADIYSRAATEDFVYDRGKVEKMISGILADASLARQTKNEELAAGAGIVVPFEDNAYTTDKRSRMRLPRASWLRYAAVVALFAGAGFFYYNNRNVPAQPVASQMRAQTENENDALPGSNKAALTLSNGKTILLNEDGRQVITDGEIAIQNNDGSIAYGKSDVVAYNTMTTPRGGQYKLKLPDGTLVWLNASSSITYPTAFPGDTRMVSMTGEAYFEVAKNPEKPFTVRTYKDEITVKGTSFNVNSYTDEMDIKTSLLEGLVEINHTLLKPGYAYIGGKIIPADLGKELAWKNGVFDFHNVKLKGAMRQIARWYDVEVRYENSKVEDILLGGEIGRNLTLQQLLKGLTDKDMHFRLEGKTLTVY